MANEIAVAKPHEIYGLMLIAIICAPFYVAYRAAKKVALVLFPCLAAIVMVGCGGPGGGGGGGGGTPDGGGTTSTVTVTIASPSDVTTLSAGTPIFVTGTASTTSSSISSVELFVDGNPYSSTTTASFSFPSMSCAAGPHTIKVCAFDNTGTTGCQSLSVTVNATFIPPTNVVITEVPSAIVPSNIRAISVNWTNNSTGTDTIRIRMFTGSGTPINTYTNNSQPPYIIDGALAAGQSVYVDVSVGTPFDLSPPTQSNTLNLQ